MTQNWNDKSKPSYKCKIIKSRPHGDFTILIELCCMNSMQWNEKSMTKSFHIFTQNAQPSLYKQVGIIAY